MGARRGGNRQLVSTREREDNLVHQVHIEDIKNSNGTFTNGERHSGEDLESKPFELESDNIVVSRFCSLPTSYTALTFNQRFSIDVVTEDNSSNCCERKPKP